jgi:LuxR family maltose regulon positive regulatory protein
LNQGTTRSLTLISAPAGFGKTTVVSDWIRQSGVPVAWLSLDEGDNDPTRLLTYFIAALQAVEAGIGETALAVLQSPQPPPIESILTVLINEIVEISNHSSSGSGGGFVLVLDDYHVIDTQSVHHVLTFLLDHLPSQMHLLIATRTDPPLPLARLRGRGQLAELRSTDLRFTPDEASEFLNQVMGLELPADDVASLETRTEGWIVGLQMAALSMQERSRMPGARDDLTDFIKAFTGSHRFVLDYLVGEVLQQQSENIQTFLLQTAILDRLTGSLCDAVRFGIAETPSSSEGTAVVGEIGDRRSEIGSHAQSQAILEYLEASNLFIVPLDSERRWYRYHHLFAELLRSQLSRTQPDLLPTLHRRASEWFEQEGLIPETVHHAIAAEDFDRATTLLESLASLLLNEGRAVTLLSLMAKLPDEAVCSSPWLSVYWAWAYFLTWQFDAVEPLLQSAELRLSEIAKVQPPEAFADYARLRGRMITLHAFMAQWRGDLPGTIELSHEALKYLDDDDLQLRSVLESKLGEICLISGDLTSARQHLNRSMTAGQTIGNFHAALGAVGRLAELEMIQGHLHQAAKTYRQTIQLGAEWGGGQPLPGNARIHVGLAQVLYEWNDLDGAARHLRRGIRLGEQYGEQEIVLKGYLNLARLKQARGQTNAAIEALERAGAITSRDSRVPNVDHVSSWQAGISLVQGDLKAAGRWADSQELELSSSDVPDFQFEMSYLTLIRVWIAQGKLEAAKGLLEQLLQAAEAEGRGSKVIEILVLRALALQAQASSQASTQEDNIGQAMTALEHALSLAEPEGYVRVFVDEGSAMNKLLRQAMSRGIAPEYVSKLLLAFDVSEYETSAPTQALTDPLSERELEVLRLLMTHLSSTEIAQELFIAVSTARSHIKSIYGKLGVHSRAQAVARAQDLGLL